MPGYTPVKTLIITFNTVQGGGQGQTIQSVIVVDQNGNPHVPERAPKNTHNGGKGRVNKWGPQPLEIQEGTTCIIIGGEEWCF